MNYTSEEFHIHYISSYTLFVNSDYAYDHLVVVDEQKNVLVFMKYETTKPSTDAMKILSLPFQYIFVTLPHQSLVLIPTDVFQHAEKDIYADYFIDQNADHTYIKNLSLGITALYQYDLLLYNRWKNLFSEAHFIPSFEVIIRQAQSNIPIQGETLGVHIYDSQADLFLYVDGALQLYNTFEVQTVDDLSYFMLSIFKNFGLTNKIQRILLSGANEGSEWGERLSKYTEDLEIIKAKSKWITASGDVKNHILNLNILIDSHLCV